MIDPDTIERDYPALTHALGGGAGARAAIGELVALLRRAGVEVPGFPTDAPQGDATGAEPQVAGVAADTELSRGEFFQVLTGNPPERLTE